MSNQRPSAESGPPLIALVCPYCGAKLTINQETVGRPYLTYEQPESIECYADDCGAVWEPNGVPRTAAQWLRFPGLYAPPVRARVTTHVEHDALMEEGRRLASQRDDLIAQGADPDDLLIPIAPTTVTPPE